MGSVRPGRLPEIWGWLVVLGLGAALWLTLRDLQRFHACHARGAAFEPSQLAWHLYFWIQIANKLPVSYRYRPRGLAAAFDLAGFAAGMLAIAAFALQMRMPQGIGIGLVGVVASWIAGQLFLGVLHPEPGVSRGRSAYCAVLAFLCPSLPMLGAALALAAGW